MSQAARQSWLNLPVADVPVADMPVADVPVADVPVTERTTCVSG